MDDALPTIPEFFSNRDVFITGASGFLGKVLVEKLLRSCPQIGTIYLLLRPKKGKTPAQRLQEITDQAVFDRVKSEQPDALKKLTPVNGDASELNLGLSEENRAEIVAKVSVIFHTAASVRFDDPLHSAILLNTRGTREVAQLALDLKNAAVFVHTSTTYCNTHQPEIDEQLYPAPVDWRGAIKMAEEMRDDCYTLDVLTHKYLGENHPNTYTFTKALGEQVVHDMCAGKVPSIVFRPSIVVSSFKEPMPGWVDNFNGIGGIVLAVGKGILKSIFTDPEMEPDYIPVDVSIKGMIVAAWAKGTSKDAETVSFYNGCGSGNVSMTTPEVVRVGLDIVTVEGMNQMIWYPTATVTNRRWEHYLRVYFCMLLPAVFVDLVLRLLKKKPLVLKVQRKIFVAMSCLEYFMFNNWHFLNKNFMALNDKLRKSDFDTFQFHTDDLDKYEFCRNGINGGRMYLLKEEINSEFNRKRVLILKCIHNVVVFSFYLFAFWIFFIKVNVPRLVIDKFTNI